LRRYPFLKRVEKVSFSRKRVRRYLFQEKVEKVFFSNEGEEGKKRRESI